MATIVNNPPPSERVIEVDRTADSTAGWAVAVVILIAVIAGIFAWLHYHHVAPQAPANGGTNINVTLPPTTGGSDNGTPPSGSGTGN